MFIIIIVCVCVCVCVCRLGEEALCLNRFSWCKTCFSYLQALQACASHVRYALYAISHRFSSCTTGFSLACFSYLQACGSHLCYALCCISSHVCYAHVCCISRHVHHTRR